MKLKFQVSILILMICCVSSVADAQEKSAKENWRDIKPQNITLFCRKTYPDKFGGYGKSAFSFKHGLRSDVGRETTHNSYELLYGSTTINKDSDWFNISGGRDNRSRVKDLGERTWDDMFDVPILHAAFEPHNGVKHSSNETYEESSNGQVTKVILGHMYVAHYKDADSDFYILLRVNELIPSDKVTISWKVVPSPEYVLKN